MKIILIPTERHEILSILKVILFINFLETEEGVRKPGREREKY